MSLSLEQKIDLLLKQGISKTRFFTYPNIPATVKVGVPIGNGACKAVILKLNRYARNSTDGTEQAVEQIYYGDADAQEFELQRGESSEIIFCNDLSEVFVRTPSACNLQVLVYEVNN